MRHRLVLSSSRPIPSPLITTDTGCFSVFASDATSANHIVQSVTKAIPSTVFSFFTSSNDIEPRTYESCRYKVRFSYIWDVERTAHSTVAHRHCRVFLQHAPVAHLDVVLPSLPNPEDFALILTSSNSIPLSLQSPLAHRAGTVNRSRSYLGSVSHSLFYPCG